LENKKTLKMQKRDQNKKKRKNVFTSMFTTAFVLADNRMILGPDLQQSYDYLTVTPSYDRLTIDV